MFVTPSHNHSELPSAALADAQELIPPSLRYTPACSRLLAQFKTIMKLVGDSVPSVDAFMSEYRVREVCLNRERS